MFSFAIDPGPSEENATVPKCSADSILLSSPHTVADSDLPDGGVVAWRTVFGAFLAQFCGLGYTSSFGVFQAFYTRHYLQNESASAISWIGSLATFLVIVSGPVSGPLFDNGYFYQVYITGAVLISLSAFMLSLVHSSEYYQVLLVQGLAYGIGRGLMYVPSLAIVSHHFKHRRTAMLSIVASGAPLGVVINTIMLNRLLNGPLSFKISVQISAAVITLLLFLSCILVRTRYSAVRHKSTSTSTWKATKKCFTEIPSLLTIIGFTLFQTSYFYPYFYFQMDSLKHGLDASFAFYSVVIINVGNFIGRLGAGALLPFLGIIDLTIMSAIACAILIIGMIWLSSTASVVVLGLLYGLFSGINIAMIAPMLGLASDPAELGVRIGMGSAIIGIGDLVGPPICGALLTRDYRWWPPALFCGVITFMSGVLFIGVRFAFARGHVRADVAQRRTSAAGQEATTHERGAVDGTTVPP